jgi:methyltransferase-like protein 6
MYAKLEKDAKRNWDLFYKANKTNFYKDRHYIKFEFKEMADQMEALQNKGSSDTQLVLLDAGCGVGNGFYPLFREYPGLLKVHCCDFSPRAVDFVK